ncbi:hypothetical protein D3C80_611450 [compost metagenome]
MNPRTAVDLLDRQLGRAGREDRSAIGGFKVGRRRRLRGELELAGATADLELAGRGHAAGHGVVAVPQQVGRGANAGGLGRQVAFKAVQLGLGDLFDGLKVAGLDHGADRRRAAHARLDVGDDIFAIAPGRGHAGPAGGEEGAGAFEGRAGGDVRVAEAVGVVAQQVGVAFAAVDLTGLGEGVLQARVNPAAEGFAGGARHHGGGVVGLQRVVRGLKILPRKIAEVLGRGAAGREGQGDNRRRSGEQTLHEGYSKRPRNVVSPCLNPRKARVKPPRRIDRCAWRLARPRARPRRRPFTRADLRPSSGGCIASLTCS